MENSDLKWYVVRAVGGKEKKVKEHLELEISRQGLEHQIEEILIPTEKVLQIKNGKKITKEKTFYPGYVFIKAQLVGEIPFIIKNVQNVIGFLGETKGGEPQPMRKSEVNRMLGETDKQSESAIELENPYTVGDAVKVVDGPFNSFEGVIDSINEEKKKLVVSVKIFERKTPLELSFMQVEKV